MFANVHCKNVKIVSLEILEEIIEKNYCGYKYGN